MSYHFTHPNHPLHEIFVESEYLCNGCNTFGSDEAYTCKTCNFVLHEVCMKCPPTFTSNLHPSHPLVLTRHAFGRSCNLCCEEAEGLHYTCELCRFVLHPLCTLLPKNVPHQVHPQHVLTLCLGNNLNNRCAVCQSEIDRSSYRCEPCGVAVHLECASEQGSPPYRVDQSAPDQGSPPYRVDQSAPEQTRGLHHTHPHHGPGHAYSNNNMGYHYDPYNYNPHNNPYNYNPHNNIMGYHYHPYNYNPHINIMGYLYHPYNYNPHNNIMGYHYHPHNYNHFPQPPPLPPPMCCPVHPSQPPPPMCRPVHPSQPPPPMCRPVHPSQPPPPTCRPVQPPPGSSGNGRKRKRMYQILGKLGLNIAASALVGFFPF